MRPIQTKIQLSVVLPVSTYPRVFIIYIFWKGVVN